MSDAAATGRFGRTFHALAPGILVAATGVGAGDLITASLAGSCVGTIIIWAALVGAVFKWTLNEGVARWQLATGTTLLEGWVDRLGSWVQWVFIVYLLVWSLPTGGALVTACGVAGAALFTPDLPLASAKVFWGVVHSLAGLLVVWIGSFRVFEKVMSVFIGVMFATVMITAILSRPDWALLGAGLMPSLKEDDLVYVLGLIGGVGGSVTLLSYGYWIREQGRRGLDFVSTCRIDLGVGYAMTALFGVAMVLIGSRLSLDKGDAVAVKLAGELEALMGPAGRWLFLLGFWGAVFSSLLGVWQSIPYLFADFLLIRGGVSVEERQQIDYTRTRAYRAYLVAIAIVPLILLKVRLDHVQLTYAVLAALFMPLLAVTLLIMNNRHDWVGRACRSGWKTNTLLVLTLAFFCYAGTMKIMAMFNSPAGIDRTPPTTTTTVPEMAPD